MCQIKLHTNENEINREEWERLLAESPYTSFFQSFECYEFYSRLSFIKPFVFGVSENGRLRGLVCGYIIANGGRLKRFFSRRAIVHGGPLFADDISEEALVNLLSFTQKELDKKVIYIEFRNNSDYGRYRTLFEESGFRYKAYLNYIVDTTEMKLVDERLSESMQRQIKKARNNGVRIIETTDQKDIGEFYNILKKLYKEEVKKPLFPKEFFEKLVSMRNGHLFVAKYNEVVISGMACVSFDQKVVYEWFVCGNKKEYNHLYPSTAVTYGAIEYATENGFDKFDFMGAGKPDEEYGVRDFKRKFGGDLVEYGRFTAVNQSLLYRIGSWVMKMKGIV